LTPDQLLAKAREFLCQCPVSDRQVPNESSQQSPARPDGTNPHHAHIPYWKRAHTDWRFWVGVMLMFLAMIVYVTSMDLACASWQSIDSQRCLTAVGRMAIEISGPLPAAIQTHLQY